MDFNSMDMETTILQSIFYDGEFFTKVFSHLDSSIFDNSSNAIIYNEMKSFVKETDTRPSVREVGLKIKNSNIAEELKKNALLKLQEMIKTQKIENTEFLLKETEKYLKKVKLTHAIFDSAEILNTNKDFEPIVDKVSNALNVSFDLSGGIDYKNSIDERLDYYHTKLNGLTSGIKQCDFMLNGGFMDKTLNVFLSASGGGKSAALVSVACAMLLKKKNILYITLEMSEKEICKRFDANILDYSTKDLRDQNPENIKIAFNNIAHTLGNLFVKEYPAGSFNALHLKALVEEYRNSKNVMFDCIFIDYLTLMSSYRTTLASSGGTYGLYKHISEELHGYAKLAQANGRVGIPIITASQLRREAFNNLDIGLDSISDSVGIAQTADVIIGILSTEALRERKESVWRFFKNRNSGILKDIVVNTDFSKMRFSDSNVETESDLASITQDIKENSILDLKSPEMSFGDFKF